MNYVFYIIRQTLISSSILILIVLLLRPALRRVPKWVNCVLWALVALRLVVPVFPDSPFSIAPRVENAAVSAYSAVTAKNEPAAAAPDGTEKLSPVQSSVRSDHERILAVCEEKHRRWDENITRQNNLGIVLAVGYPAGVLLMLSYGLVSYIMLKRKLRTAVLVEKGVKKSEFIASPFVMGFFRSAIYLPSSLDDKNVGYVLAHERAHIRRGDNRFKVIAFLILSLYWFDPLVWISFVLFCRDMEVACDEKTIRNMSENERCGYASALLECSINRRVVAACPIAFGETDVKQRVENAVKYKKPAIWISAAAAVLCAVCAVCFLTDASVADNADFPDEYNTAVSSLVTDGELQYHSRYGEEVFAEAHHIYGAEKKDGVIKIYATVSYSGFGFINGYFTDKCGLGVTPVLVTLPENCDASEGHVEYPFDGEYYGFSIEEMIPYSLRKQMEHHEAADRNEFRKQMTAAARQYLDSIGRTEEVRPRSEIDIGTLSKHGISGEVQQKIADIFPEKSNYPIYGTEERLINGQRIVYSTLYYSEYNEIVFRKYVYDTGDTLAQYVFNAQTGARKDPSQTAYPAFEASWDKQTPGSDEWTTAAFTASEADVREAEPVPAETALTLSVYIQFRDAFASSPEDALKLVYPNAVSSPGQDGLMVSSVLYSEFMSLMLRYFTDEFYEKNFGAAYKDVKGHLAYISGGGTGMYEDICSMTAGDMTCLMTVYNNESDESYQLLATMEKHGDFHRLADIQKVN